MLPTPQEQDLASPYVGVPTAYKYRGYALAPLNALHTVHILFPSGHLLGTYLTLLCDINTPQGCHKISPILIGLP